MSDDAGISVRESGAMKPVSRNERGPSRGRSRITSIGNDFEESDGSADSDAGRDNGNEGRVDDPLLLNNKQEGIVKPSWLDNISNDMFKPRALVSDGGAGVDNDMVSIVSASMTEQRASLTSEPSEDNNKDSDLDEDDPIDQQAGGLDLAVIEDFYQTGLIFFCVV
jgi:hypothetical protein